MPSRGTCCTFQLTRPVWGEPRTICSTAARLRISTHSPRVGRTFIIVSVTPYTIISTHSPRVGRTLTMWTTMATTRTFQLTRPVWGEPQIRFDGRVKKEFQLTRPVWGEPDGYGKHQRVGYISTHSPRVGRTARSSEYLSDGTDFNSLAPCGANLILII